METWAGNDQALGAAAHMLAEVDELTTDPALGVVALQNAAVCFEMLRMFPRALALYESLVQKYPGSELAPAALFRVARNWEQSYDFDRAIAAYTRLGETYSTSKERPEALFNIARLHEGSQRYAAAAAAYLRFSESYPMEADAPAARFRAAQLLRRAGDTMAATSVLQKLITELAGKAEFGELVEWARLALQAEKKCALGIRDSINAFDVAETVRANSSAISACIIKSKERENAVGSQLVMKWSILDDGSTAHIEVLSNEHAQTWLADCVRSEIASWNFPRHCQSFEPVIYPFDL